MQESQTSKPYMPGRLPLIVFVFVTLIGLLNAGVIISNDLANARSPAIGKILLDEISGVWSFLLLLPMIVRLMLRYPVRKPHLAPRLLLHLFLSAVFGVMQTTIMYGSRTIIYWLLDWGEYHFGEWFYAMLMEYHKQLLSYVLVYGATHFIYSIQQSAAVRERASRLNEQLTHARLQMLQMQLNPHFLFNTLNVISATMHDNVNRADQMITRLGDLLRATLREKPELMHSVSEEIELLESYSDLMKARFGEQLVITFDVEETLGNLRLPVFILQPLLENAINYSMDAHGEAEILLSVARSGQDLRLQVTDNGPGIEDFSQLENSDGLGISNVRMRLQSLYQRDDLLTFSTPPAGGLQVTITLPDTSDENSGER